MAKLVAHIESNCDLHVSMPKHASSYYAIAQADLNRIPSDVYCIPGGLLTVDYSCPYQYHFSIHENDGSWVTELPQFDQLTPSADRTVIDQHVAFLEDRFTVFNVCHLLFDKLGRSTEFDEFPIDSFLLFRNNDYINDLLSILDMVQTDLGSTKEGVVTYQFTNLYVSTSTFRFRHPGFNFRPRVVTMLNRLKKRFAEKSATIPSAKRIFIDRKTVSARDVVNRDVLLDVLDDFDFELVTFEDYTLEGQASLVGGVDVMMGVHGAGLSNALFLKDSECLLLELLPPLCASCDYWKLASAFGFKYDGYIAKDLELPTPDYGKWVHNSKLNRRDILVNEVDFRNFLTHHLT